MNIPRAFLSLLALTALAGGRIGAADTASAPGGLAPYFTPPASVSTAPDADGFIRRWLLLEPINKPNRGNAGFVDSYIRRELTREYFPGQFTVLPRDGDKVTAEGEELAWHALDSTKFNVKLFRFASGLNKRIYGVIFWAVTVVDCPSEIADVRLAVGSNSASLWWINGDEAVALTGDRRMVMDDCVSKRLTLKKGRNVLRGAVINGPGMSDFCVRVIDGKGQPVRAFTVTLEPSAP